MIYDYEEADYKFLKKLFAEKKPDDILALREYLANAMAESCWETIRHESTALFVTIKEALWEAEEAEDYEFCGLLLPFVNECSKYCDLMAEELEQNFI